MSDTNPAIDRPEQEQPEHDGGEDAGTTDVGSAPALQRRNSGGGDTMS